MKCLLVCTVVVFPTSPVGGGQAEQRCFWVSAGGTWFVARMLVGSPTKVRLTLDCPLSLRSRFPFAPPGLCHCLKY